MALGDSRHFGPVVAVAVATFLLPVTVEALRNSTE